MNQTERFAYWKKIAGLDPATPWTDEYALYGYFQVFRPDGQGVEKVFHGIDRGDEILSRLMPFYHHTRDSPGDAYFVIRNPQPVTRSELHDVMNSCLGCMGQPANAMNDQELIEILRSAQIESKQGTAPPLDPNPMRNDPSHVIIYDVLCDWFNDLEPAPNDALFLHEAFYSMACDYYLANHLMWPLYRDTTSIEDPFAPFFQLWIRGAEFRFVGERLTVYAPLLQT